MAHQPKYTFEFPAIYCTGKAVCLTCGWEGRTKREHHTRQEAMAECEQIFAVHQNQPKPPSRPVPRPQPSREESLGAARTGPHATQAAASSGTPRWVFALVGAGLLVALVVFIASQMGPLDSECYTTGEVGSAQYDRDVERAAKFGCDDVRDESPTMPWEE